MVRGRSVIIKDIAEIFMRSGQARAHVREDWDCLLARALLLQG
jgi:hypothetical protein